MEAVKANHPFQKIPKKGQATPPTEYHQGMKRSIVLISVLAALSLSAAPKPLQIKEADKGKEFTLKLHDTFSVTLPTNPSTGYSWYVLTGTSTWKLKSRFIITPKRTKNPPMPGAPVTEVFTFQTTGKGTSDLRLVPARSYGDPPKMEDLWSVRISVE